MFFELPAEVARVDSGKLREVLKTNHRAVVQVDVLDDLGDPLFPTHLFDARD